MEQVEAWIEIKDGVSGLNINRIATEDDLEQNHYLEEVGQTVEHVVINILYCPYCGVKLLDGKKNVVPSFHHNDFSKW